jgi:GT2 family glycosyltransferase
MFVRRKAFEAAGMFDTRYFMYAEDVDLCYGIRMSGFKVYYAGDARIIHHGGKSTDHADTRQVPVAMMRESTHALLTKWKSRRYADAYKKAQLLTAALRCTALLLAYPLALAGGGAARIRWSLAKWTTIFQWAAGNRGIRQALGRFCNDGA